MKNSVQKIIHPYTGEKSYIFISYSHKDSTEVHSVIRVMQEQGYRVWYDEGIDPGTEWDENVAEHILKCDYFIAFISPQYLESTNCKDELNYARDLGKERLLIYMDNVDLPAGMSMRLSRIQAIHKYRYEDEADFYDKLFTAKGIGSFASKENSLCSQYYSFNDFCQEYPNDIDLAKKCNEIAQGSAEIVFASGTDYAKRTKLITSIKNRAKDLAVADIDTVLNDLIDALQKREQANFYEKYEKEQLLVLDDFQFCSGKTATQETLYILIKNRLKQGKSTIIFSTRNDFFIIDSYLTGLIGAFPHFEF